MKIHPRIALCSGVVRAERLVALCKVKLSQDGRPPEWVELVPPGPAVNAVDGRRFKNTSPERIVEAFRRYGLDLPIDYEHASELKAPKGDEAPAAGWITDLAVREGGVWAKVEWTPRGLVSLTAREYRYISPAFLHTKAGDITELVSAGLTNKPALTQLAELARTQEDMMDPEMLKLLGLDEKATPEQVADAIKKMKAMMAKAETDMKEMAARHESEVASLRANSATDLTKFVPRADFDAALARAAKAEQLIADEKAAALKREIDGEVDAAVKAGKITPATADFYRSTCAQQDGLAKFREFVKAAPVVAAPSNLDEKRPPASGEPTVTDEQLAIATRCGLTKEQFIAGLKAQA